MPTQVVVVKRSRQRPFEVLWAIPVWIRSLMRSIWVSLARRLSLGASGASASWARADEMDLRRPVPAEAMWPELKSDRSEVESPQSLCHGCGECVTVCPSRCLSLVPGAGAGEVETRPDDHSGGDEARLLLSMWRCIGCGKCVEACPHDALEMKPALVSAWAPTRAAQRDRDLSQPLRVRAEAGP